MQPARGRNSRMRQVLVVAAVLLAWELVVRVGLLPSFVLSSPSAIPPEFANLLSSVEFWQEFGVTLGCMAAGLVVGGGLAIAVALAIGRRRAARTAIDPVALGVYAMPSIALFPLFLIWLGFGVLPAIVVGALHTFPPMLLSTYEAVDQEELAYANSVVLMGGRTWDVVRFARLPGYVPRLLPAVRQALASLLAIVVASGMVAPTGTLGNILIQATNKFDTPAIIALVLILGVVGVALNLIVDLAERRVREWRAS
jgi:ABC-type nitrate/sulfonate/bicarbonate transport system permease component